MSMNASLVFSEEPIHVHVSDGSDHVVPYLAVHFEVGGNLLTLNACGSAAWRLHAALESAARRVFAIADENLRTATAEPAGDADTATGAATPAR